MKPDDLKPGLLVAVTQYKGDIEESSNWMGFSQKREPRFDGKPWKVAAVSLPFVCLTDGYESTALDTRLWTLTRVSRQYAQAFERDHKPEVVFGKRRKKKVKPDKRDCPRCGQRTVSRLKVPGKGIWIKACRNCGYEGEPIS